MSSEILSNDSVNLGSNRAAWWGSQEGRLKAGQMTPLYCFADGIGAREINESKVYTSDGLIVDGVKALVARHANGNSTALSVVGENYGVLQDSKFFEILEQVYHSRPLVETAGTLRNGRRIWALVQAGEWSVAGDKVKSYDLWLNTHDGSGQFSLYATEVRVVCQNTWNLAIGAKGSRVIGVRHTSGIEGMIAQSIALLTNLRDARALERAKAAQLASMAMAQSEARAFFGELIGLKAEAEKPSVRLTNQVDELETLFSRGTGNLGRTRWDAFNAVTEFVDHSRTVRLTDGRGTSEARFESSLMGSGDAVKARAFSLLTA
jgi:phage/plasmid-like protein (TIGR03299 family)